MTTKTRETKLTVSLLMAPPTTGGSTAADFNFLPTEEDLSAINRLQASRGKPPVQAADILVIPVRLCGDGITSQGTQFMPGEVASMANQINQSGGPALVGHLLEANPVGQFYKAKITPENGINWLDTMVYVPNDDDGVELANRVALGIINEASIGADCLQWICSITGGDYWESPYIKGRTYEVFNQITNQMERKTCIAYLRGCTFNEGSLVYRGAHPGTRVGDQSVRFSDKPSQTHLGKPEKTKEEDVNLQLLAVTLGLAAGASEKDVTTGIQQLKTGADKVLKLLNVPDLAAAEGMLIQLQEKAQRFDQVNTELAQLKEQAATEKRVRLISEGKASGKITPAMEDWAKAVELSSLEGYLAAAAPQVPGGGQNHQPPTKPSADSVQLTAEDRQTIQLLGLSEDEFLKNKGGK